MFVLPLSQDVPEHVTGLSPTSLKFLLSYELFYLDIYRSSLRLYNHYRFMSATSQFLRKSIQQRPNVLRDVISLPFGKRKTI